MNPYQSHTDAELLAMLGTHDQHAFATLYHRYAKDLYRYARRNVPFKEDCEEMIQDIFTSLWERREKLFISSLHHYLFSAMRNRIIRYMQHNAVKKKYADHYRLFESMYEYVMEEKSTENIRKVIEEIIAELPDRCREAFQLRLNENLSNAQIAERMNVTKKTVELYMSRAFGHIRLSYDKLFK